MKVKINGNILIQKGDSDLFGFYILSEPATGNKTTLSLWVRGGRLWMGAPDASAPYPSLVKETIKKN